jgi:ubiquinone/menaquinone biosynthesis C-methylase UbiE
MTFNPDAFRAFEREAHDRLAEAYDRSFTPVTGLAMPALLDAVRAQRGQSVLDVASGPGLVARAAADRGLRAIGTDLSPRMVALASARHPGIDFRVADVEALPFPDATFDAVVCNFGLGHFPRPEASVAECVRVLAPGGRLAFAWWDSLKRQRLQGVFREAIQAAGATPPAAVPQGHDVFRFSDTREFHALLVGAGLEDVTIRDVTDTLSVPDADALWQIGLDSLAVTSATIVHATVPTQQAIRAAFDTIAETYWTGGRLRIPVAFKIGSGRKPS